MPFRTACSVDKKWSKNWGKRGLKQVSGNQLKDNGVRQKRNLREMAKAIKGKQIGSKL